MKDLPITQADEELIAAAIKAIEDNFSPGKHRVGAAVRGKSGQIYVGIHVDSNAVDVCAEWVALGTAMTNGEREIISMVAVMKQSEHAKPEVVSPCGVCRELILTYSRETEVLYLENGEIKKSTAQSLLPGAYIPPSKRCEVAQVPQTAPSSLPEKQAKEIEMLALQITASVGDVVASIRSIQRQEGIGVSQQENLKHRLHIAVTHLKELESSI